MLRRASVLFCFLCLTAAAPLPEHAAPKKMVAILYFDNYTGTADYDPLGKGIASMMISDLSAVKEIQLLERDRMQDLVKEIDAQHTKYFDSTTAVKVGKIVGAEYIVVGAFAALQPKMRIDTRVVRVQTGEIVKTAQVTGDQDKFFDLEQALADKLIDGLGVALSPDEHQQLAAQERANRVDQLSTMAGFSNALALYDRGDYTGAAQKMAPVVQASPNSMFLRVAFSEMKNRAAASAADKAKDKVKAGIGGLIKRPPANER
ncbi:MAG: CsgG/HfaB family protein [bacterium]